MKSYFLPLVLWTSAVAGLLLQLLTNGMLETLGLVLLLVPLLVVTKYAVSAGRLGNG
jgi:hypothetical protein